MTQLTLAKNATHAVKDAYIAKLLADLRAAGKQADAERNAHSETKGDLAVAQRAYKPKADRPCAKCSGTGWFSFDESRGCYQCGGNDDAKGKGFQSDADQRRNWGYGRNNAPTEASEPRAARPAYVPRPPTEAELSFRARCATAKAAAMAGGQAVLV